MLNENTLYILGNNPAIYLPNYDISQNGNSQNTLAIFLPSEQNEKRIDSIILRKIDEEDPAIIVKENKISFKNTGKLDRILIPEFLTGKSKLRTNSQFKKLETKYKEMFLNQKHQ